MEAHGSMRAKPAQAATGLLPDTVAAAMMLSFGVDRLAALVQAIETVRRGGTLSIVGIYGGMADPLPMLKMFDKGIQLRMGQAHVRRWIDQLMPLVLDQSDRLGVLDLATHHMRLADAPRAYELFQRNRTTQSKLCSAPSGQPC